MPTTLVFRLATVIAVELLAVVGASSNDSNTGIPYFTPVVVGVSVVGILGLYRISIRTLIREQAARIKTLHADIATERERSIGLQTALATEQVARNRLARDVDEVRFDNTICEWRVTMLLRLVERTGVEIPGELLKPNRLYREQGPPDELA